MRTLIAAVVGVVALVGTPVAAQDMEGLAKSLSTTKPETPPACPKKLPDGSCPDTVDTRQMRLPGAAAAGAAASAAGRAIRADISMTFVKGSAELTARAKAALDRLAKALVSAGSYRPFTVEGHTDSSGTPAGNQALSQARAESVAKYLAAKGVDQSKITAKGFGSDHPLKGHAPTDPANRRVEVSAS